MPHRRTRRTGPGRRGDAATPRDVRQRPGHSAVRQFLFANDNTIGVQTAALDAFMAAALLAGLAVIGQAMFAQVRQTQAAENNARGALGMTASNYSPAAC